MSNMQLHVNLSPSDAKKLNKLARGANVSLSDAVRSMIRAASTLTAVAAKKAS